VVTPGEEEGWSQVQMIEHLKAPLTDPSEVEGLLTDMYWSVVAFVHDEPLPSYEAEG
jgi:hypothetical protein